MATPDQPGVTRRAAARPRQSRRRQPAAPVREAATGAAPQVRESRRAPLAGACLSAGLALVVYLRTMAPTITFHHSGADSGDLVTAAINLGVPHPTGYPLYTMLAHLFTALPGEPARNVTLLSALAGAAAVGLVFWAAYQLIARREEGGPLALVAAFSAAGILACGQLLWSQSTIAEVYSLNALWAAAVLVVLLSSAPARPYIVALLCGLGLAHHLTAVWLLPALWPYLGAVRRWLTRQRALKLALCLLPGLLAYLYFPLRARLHPMPNWGLADNLSGLLWLVSAEAYHRYLGGVVPAQVAQRVAAWAGIWVRDLGVVGLALAFQGLWRAWEKDRRLAAFGLSWVLLLSGYSMVYTTGDSYLYLLPAAAMMALWMAWGGYVVLRELSRQQRIPQRLGWLAVAVLLALPAVSVVSRFSELDLSADRQAYVWAESALDRAAPNSVVLTRGDAQTFSTWYLRYGLDRRPDVVIVDRWLLLFPWYRTDLAARDAGLAPLARAQDDQEAALMLLSIAGRPVLLAYRDDALLAHGEWTADGDFYRLGP